MSTNSFFCLFTTKFEMRVGETGWISLGSGRLVHQSRVLQIHETMGGTIHTSFRNNDDEVVAGIVDFTNRGKLTASEVTVEVEVQQTLFENGKVSQAEFAEFLEAAKRKLKARHPGHGFFEKPSDLPSDA